jgi:SAM-dependent methyltransferase
MLRRLVESLARRPAISNCVRGLLEGGFRRHRALLQRKFPVPPRLTLDVGCGGGVHAGWFPPESYLGVDIDPAFVGDAARAHPRHRFLEMDARRLAFDSASFDAAILSGVIHHLSDADARLALAEVRRVLRPDGRFLIWEDIPTRAAWNLVGRAVHRLDLGNAIRTAEQYRELLAGPFDVLESETFRSGFMDYAAFLCRPRAE